MFGWLVVFFTAEVRRDAEEDRTRGETEPFIGLGKPTAQSVVFCSPLRLCVPLRWRLLSVYTNRETIKRRRDARRQLGLEIGVEVVVRQVRQIRPLGADQARRRDGFRNAEMRRMLGAEQRVQHERVGA